MNDLKVVNPKDFGIAENKALELTKDLNPILDSKKGLIDRYNSIIDLDINEDSIAKFRELRLEIVKNRTKGIVSWHKVNKEFYLAGGRFVDAIKNKEVAGNQAMENELLKKEKHFENLETQRIEKLNSDRLKLVSPFLDNVEGLYLADMEEDVFEAYLTTKKRNHEAIIEAERKREADRLAKIEEVRIEQERVKAENEKLRKEAEEKAKKDAIEAKKRADEEAKRQKEIEVERKKQQILIQKAKAEKARIEAKLKAKEKEEEKRISEEKARIEAEKLAKIEAEKAPLKEKMKNWVNSLSVGVPPEINNTTKEIVAKFDSFKNWAKSEITKM